MEIWLAVLLSGFLGFVIFSLYQYKAKNRSRPLHWVVVLAATALAIGLFLKRDELRRRLSFHWPMTYGRQLHEAVVNADRIVIRDGGFDCCGPVDREPILASITDPAEIRQVYEHLAFERVRVTNSWETACMCCGWPGIDWYRGEKRLALTAVQHGHSVRWQGFSTQRVAGFRRGYGDAALTEESATWLHAWLVRKGVRRESKTETEVSPPPGTAVGEDDAVWSTAADDESDLGEGE